MTPRLRLGRVDDVRLAVRFVPGTGAPPCDVFLLDVRPPDDGPRFEADPYLELLDPVLGPEGSPPGRWAVRVDLGHDSGSPSAGSADVVLTLAPASEPPYGAATEAVRAAFEGILGYAGGDVPPPLDHDAAIAGARRRVASAYPGVPAADLAVTDEEHAASRGRWSVGLSRAARDRFEVVLGFVDGSPLSTHIVHRPGAEIVDSVGTST